MQSAIDFGAKFGTTPDNTWYNSLFYLYYSILHVDLNLQEQSTLPRQT